MLEERGEVPPGLEFLEMNLDAGWYGRRCRKIVRDSVGSTTFGKKIIHFLRSVQWQKELYDVYIHIHIYIYVYSHETRFIAP